MRWEFSILPHSSTQINLFPFAPTPVSPVWLSLWQAAKTTFLVTLLQDTDPPKRGVPALLVDEGVPLCFCRGPVPHKGGPQRTPLGHGGIPWHCGQSAASQKWGLPLPTSVNWANPLQWLEHGTHMGGCPHQQQSGWSSRYNKVLPPRNGVATPPWG